MNEVMFIGYPEATLKASADPKSATVKKVLWGDWAKVTDENGPYKKIHCRNADGWVHENDLQLNRVLEVNFIDVGQGDGCFIVTPDDKNILIDAGESDNMYRFLRWRFNLDNNDYRVPIQHLIISHSDSDHYNGFKYIINSPRFAIQNIHHNGIVERTGTNSLGPLDSTRKYLTDVISTHAQAKQLLEDKANRGTKFYPNLLYNALDFQKVESITMLEKGSVIPGYSKTDEVYFNILGPVTETVDNKKVLRYFEDAGKTKNGHSVIIQLVIGKIKLLLGGDLNEHSEAYLTKHYTGIDPEHATDSEIETMITEGRKVFQSDILKSCHHGSHNFMDDFLSFFNPVATIISSGDNETHTHPRPDTLGAIGKNSRGKRPLIFSTELARSAKEKVTISDDDIAKLALLIVKSKLTTISSPEKKQILEEIKAIKYKMERAIAVYGMINVRTDGKKVIIAQKKEEQGAGFIIHKLEFINGELAFKK